MKKIVLSTIAVLSIAASSVSAEDTKFYVDDNGQVFTKSASDRKPLEMGHKSTPVFSHTDKLKFSGLTYIGLTHNRYADRVANPNETNFELRRAYFQLKAYLLDDPKSYYRVTLDMHQNAESDMVVRAKYAYLYLNNVLPNTGVEVGLAHRPWHDYEEHNAWYYRDISKVLIEAKNGGDLSNSADFGIMTKTKTEYFDADIGIFNGEGYHSDFNDDEASDKAGNGMSLEWRLTAHLMGVNGKDKQTKKTYADASFFGQYNKEHKASASGFADDYDDLVFYGVHGVYNMPSFLVSAQYVKSEDTAENNTFVSAQAGSGYSVNGEFRLGDNYEYRVLARYDSWTDKEQVSSDEREQTSLIAGVAWQQNHNVQWVANMIVKDNEKDAFNAKADTADSKAYMLTAQIEF
ncbi:hypothetical protein [Sulfurimonas sp.]|uniref:hypothetical protein n=1 Tax=Sulfurimonas sp. TaxID=2022749 RepID=UPI0035669849